MAAPATSAVAPPAASAGAGAALAATAAVAPASVQPAQTSAAPASSDPAPAAQAGAGPATSGTGAGAGGGGPTPSSSRKNRIQVSNTKRPLYFYINLSKRFLEQFGEVELSGLGAAIPTVVTIAEILKNDGLAVEKRVGTSVLPTPEAAQGSGPLKVRIEVVLRKTAQFQEIMELAAAEAAVAPPENGHYK